METQIQQQTLRMMLTSMLSKRWQPQWRGIKYKALEKQCLVRHEDGRCGRDEALNDK
jgi:hypothetical protein